MNKFLFFIKRPPVILAVGSFRSEILDRKKVLIFKSDIEELENFKFFLKWSKKPILTIESLKDEKEVLQIEKMAKILSKRGYLLLNFDDDRARELKELSRCLTYGFFKKADLQATDLNIDSEGANFKINYQGSIVPFWIESIFEKKQVYGFLAAIAAGIILGLNLVEMSQEIRRPSSLNKIKNPTN